MKLEAVPGRVVIVYGEPVVCALDAVLLDELQARGIQVDVRFFADAGAPWRLRLGARLRARIERLLSRATGLRMRETLPNVIPADTFEELVEASRGATVIWLAGGSGLLERLAGDGSTVLVPSLNGRRENLAMQSVLEGAAQSYDLLVSRVNPGGGPPVVVERSLMASGGSWAALDQESFGRRAIGLILRAVAGQADETVTFGDPETRQTQGAIGAMLSCISRALFHRLVRRVARPDAWFLAYRVGTGPDDRDAPLRYLSGAPDSFYADPCVVEGDGVTYLFCEEYGYRKGRGVVSVSTLRIDGTFTTPQVVLEEPFHLSYPFVFQHEGQWWMVPESAESRSVRLYRAVEFPHTWRFEKTLLENINAVDATLYFDGTWWMFLNEGVFGSSTWDELSLYMADQLAGSWHPHPRNPVKRDLRSGRPAGRLFRDSRGLIRPSQDCSVVYGGGVRFNRIVRMDAGEFEEEVLDFLPPASISGAVGLHTWSATRHVQVVDARLPLTVLGRQKARRSETISAPWYGSER